MPPQNPNQAPSPVSSDPSDPSRYEFFMNPPKPPKQKLPIRNLGGYSLGKRIAIIVGGGTLLMIILWIIASVAGGGSSTTQQFITIAEEQNEMVRLAANAGFQASNTDTKNFASNAQTSLSSAQQSLLLYLAGVGVKPSPNQLALKHKAATDQQLTTAKAASLYDQTFLTIMQTQLNAYANSVKIAFNNTKGPKGRQLLNNEYIGAQLLLKQLQTAQNN